MTKENQNIEWKESWRDEYLKWICGFANAHGGKIYIGKNDNGIVTGILNARRLLEDIPNKISNFLGIIADVNATNEQLLDSLKLIESEKFTRAAVLLFHHNPEKWIPGAYLKIGYFESDADLRYQDEVHGSIISQADKVIDLLYTKYLKADISYQGVTRVETYPYPKEAIREAVYNAIVHKNYATLIPIQISVYSDKIYIGNDCIFPEGWTVNHLLEKHRSRPYNPLIANTFFRAGYIESWGRGIEKIRESCKENGNEMAEYKVTSSEIMVIFKSLKQDNTQDDTQDDTQDNSLSEKEKKILEFCTKPRSKQEITKYMGYKTIKSIKVEMENLLIDGKLVMTIPDKVKSRNQKYVSNKENK